jgi:hypothetical protein
MTMREVALQIAEALRLALQIVEETGVPRKRIAHCGDGPSERLGKGKGRDTGVR